MAEVFHVPVNKRGFKAYMFATVDAKHKERVISIPWHLSTKGYVDGAYLDSEKRLVNVRLHHLILNAPKGAIVDHIDGNKLNNTEANLRLSSNLENARNRRKQKLTTSSKYVGVSYNPKCAVNPWQAYCEGNSLGYWPSEEMAAYARNLYVQEHWGLHTFLNPVDKPHGFDEIASKNILNKGKKRKGIYLRDNGTYCVQKQYKKLRFNKTFKNLEKAETYLASADLEICKLKLLETIEHSSNPISRNLEGVAVREITSIQDSVFCKIDDDIYFKYQFQTMHVNEEGYVVVYFRKTTTSKQYQRLLHRLVINANSETIVDHINHDKLDCRRANLRIATQSVNAHNRKLNDAHFLGVTKPRHTKLFHACIRKDGMYYDCGRYASEYVAAWARDQMAKHLYGEDARLNGVHLDNYIFDFQTGRARECTMTCETQTSQVTSHNRIKSENFHFRGVHEQKNRFYVMLQKNGKRYNGGRYKNILIAAWASDQLSLVLNGPYAKINNVPQPPGYIFDSKTLRAVPHRAILEISDTKNPMSCTPINT